MPGHDSSQQSNQKRSSTASDIAWPGLLKKDLLPLRRTRLSLCLTNSSKASSEPHLKRISASTVTRSLHTRAREEGGNQINSNEMNHRAKSASNHSPTQFNRSAVNAGNTCEVVAAVLFRQIQSHPSPPTILRAGKCFPEQAALAWWLTEYQIKGTVRD
jgi:hypothetical protein